MVIPILVLAVPSAAIGWISKPVFLRMVVPAMPGVSHAGIHGELTVVAFIATGLALLGIAVAWLLYGRGGRMADGPPFRRRAQRARGQAEGCRKGRAAGCGCKKESAG